VVAKTAEITGKTEAWRSPLQTSAVVCKEVVGGEFAVAAKKKVFKMLSVNHQNGKRKRKIKTSQRDSQFQRKCNSKRKGRKKKRTHR
jgi:hypothetical protein